MCRGRLAACGKGDAKVIALRHLILGSPWALARVHDVGQHLLESRIELGKNYRGTVSLRTLDPSGETAMRVFSVAANANYQLHVRPFRQGEVICFNKGALKADIAQSALSQFHAIVGEYLYVGPSTRAETTFGRRRLVFHRAAPVTLNYPTGV